MKHVLIIEKDSDVSLAIEARLAALGACAFERVWTEEQAISAAARRLPDLLVVGAIDDGCPFSAARSISDENDVPTLLATRAGTRRRPLPADARLDGPFPVNAVAWPVRAAERSEHDVAAS